MFSHFGLFHFSTTTSTCGPFPAKQPTTQLHRCTYKVENCVPSLTRFSLKRLLRMDAERLPLASRIPVSMASLLRSDSVKPLRNSSSCQKANINIVLQADLDHTFTFFQNLYQDKLVMTSKTSLGHVRCVPEDMLGKKQTFLISSSNPFSKYL